MMGKIKKLRKCFPAFILISVFVFSVFLCFLSIPSTQAADFKLPDLQIKGLVDLGPAYDCTGPDGKPQKCVPWIGQYIAGIYTYAIGIVGILAAVVLMIGGVIWITAGGNQTRIGEAKAWIGASLTGLILALCSYLILYTINPDLTKITPIRVNVVSDTDTQSEKGGCCIYNYNASETDIRCTSGLNITAKVCKDPPYDSTNFTQDAECYTAAQGAPETCRKVILSDGDLGCCVYDDNSGRRHHSKNRTKDWCDNLSIASKTYWVKTDTQCVQSEIGLPEGEPLPN